MPYQRSRQRILVVLGLGLSPGVGAAVEGCKPSAPLVSSDGAVATSQPPPVTPPGTIGHLPEPSCVTAPILRLDLRDAGITTII